MPTISLSLATDTTTICALISGGVLPERAGYKKARAELPPLNHIEKMKTTVLSLGILLLLLSLANAGILKLIICSCSSPTKYTCTYSVVAKLVQKYTM